MARTKKEYSRKTHIKSPATGRHILIYGTTWKNLKQAGQLKGKKYDLYNPPEKKEVAEEAIVKQSNIFEDVKGLSQEDLKKLVVIIKEYISVE